MAETSQQDAPRRVGGWLLVLCRLLIVLHPLSLAVTASNVMNALFLRGAPVAIVLLMRLAVVAFGVAAGRMLQNVRPGAVELARARAPRIGGARRLRLHDAVFPEQPHARRHDVLRDRVARLPRRLDRLPRPLETGESDLRLK